MFRAGLPFFSTVIVILISFCSTINASFSITGKEAYIMAPAAQVIPLETVKMTFMRGFDQSAVGRVSYSFFPNLEIGLSNPYITTTASDWRLDGKFRILQESDYAPEFAAGFRSDGYYLVLTKSIRKFDIVLDLGMGNNVYRNGFLGISKDVWIGKAPEDPSKIDTTKGLRLTIMADYVPESLNAGIRAFLSPQIALDVGFIDLQAPMIGLSFWSKFE